MYSIIFTYGCEHEWFNYDSKKEANKKFNALKKMVDESYENKEKTKTIELNKK